MRAQLIAGLVAASLVLAACGGDDDSTQPAGQPASEPAAQPANEPAAQPASEPAAQPASEPASEPAAVESSGGGGDRTATLTLSDGTSYEFSVLCYLEKQEAAGSEILFTVTSYDDPGLDVTQFGDQGTVTGVATISVYDGQYNTLWEANSSYEPFGGKLELTLDGSTVRGSGGFFADGDVANTPVDGEFEAHC